MSVESSSRWQVRSLALLTFATVAALASAATVPSVARGQVHPTEHGGPSATMVNGIAACPHDAGRWHGLVERHEDGSVACSYGHEHKDDPHALDDIFGPPAYGLSHPWETHRENELKHPVYAWYTVRDAPCVNPNGPYGFTALRVQAHADGHAGALTRFHSFGAEVIACDTADPSYRGFARFGGHLDFGRLQLLNEPEPPIRVPLANDRDPHCGDAGLGTSRRIHMAAGAKLIGIFTWYGENARCHLPSGGVRPIAVDALGLLQEDRGPIDPASPNEPLLFHGTLPVVGTLNGSQAEPVHLLAIRVPREADALDGVADGHLTWSGWTNRFGEIVAGCAAPAADCVPVEIRNLKVGTYQFRASFHGLTVREYDVQVDGQSLIQYPT